VTTAVLALENPIGLEDYRGAVPPQPIEALINTEMAQTPASLHVGHLRRLATSRGTRRYFFACAVKPRVSALSAGVRAHVPMIFAEPIRHEYPLLKMPVLLIIGQSARSVFFRRYASANAIKPLGDWPALGRQAIRDLPDGKLVEIVDAGHVSHIEKPEEFETALTAFLTDRFP
jgi:pimeloyl-ACP methyl ester carboxylesterase